MKHECDHCNKSIKEVGSLRRTIVKTLHGKPIFRLCKECRDYAKKNDKLPEKELLMKEK